MWLPISCPAADIALTLSGYLSTQKPQRKKVALTLYLLSVSSINGVLSSSHADDACGRAGRTKAAYSCGGDHHQTQYDGIYIEHNQGRIFAMQAVKKETPAKKKPIVVVRKFCGEKTAEQVVMELMKAHANQT